MVKKSKYFDDNDTDFQADSDADSKDSDDEASAVDPNELEGAAKQPGGTPLKKQLAKAGTYTKLVRLVKLRFAFKNAFQNLVAKHLAQLPLAAQKCSKTLAKKAGSGASQPVVRKRPVSKKLIHVPPAKGQTKTKVGRDKQCPGPLTSSKGPQARAGAGTNAALNGTELSSLASAEGSAPDQAIVIEEDA